MAEQKIKARDAPAKAQTVDKAKSRKMIRDQAEGSAGSKLSLEEKKNGSGKLQQTLPFLVSIIP